MAILIDPTKIDTIANTTVSGMRWLASHAAVPVACPEESVNAGGVIPTHTVASSCSDETTHFITACASDVIASDANPPTTPVTTPLAQPNGCATQLNTL